MTANLIWRKSVRCESHTCVEVAEADGMLVRDGKLGDDSPVLTFSAAAWRSFLDGQYAQRR